MLRTLCRTAYDDVLDRCAPMLEPPSVSALCLPDPAGPEDSLEGALAQVPAWNDPPDLGEEIGAPRGDDGAHDFLCIAQVPLG